MKHQKWLIAAIVFGLLAGTAVLLVRLKASQRLGKPGIKATPIEGSVAMKLDLPAQVMDYVSSNVPEDKVTLDYLPKDTSYVRRLYIAPDGFNLAGTVILMGSDRTSIHRPEMCLLGGGWQASEKKVVNIPIEGAHPYQLPIMKWVITRPQDGAYGLYLFWFVADNEMASDNVTLQLYLVRDLLFKGVLQRWAYMSYFVPCRPGQDDIALDRATKFIAASVPEFQLPPASSGLAATAKPGSELVRNPGP